MVFLTRWIRTSLGTYLKGNIMYILLVIFLIVLMYLSISGTYSSAEHVFNIGKNEGIGSNSLSANIISTWNPQYLYSRITVFSLTTTVAIFLSDNASTLMNLTFCGNVMRNGTLFRSIISIVS